LIVPDGFKIERFASNVINTRQFSPGNEGAIFVGRHKEGKVYALVDENNDGKADNIDNIKHYIATLNLYTDAYVARYTIAGFMEYISHKIAPSQSMKRVLIA